MERKFIPGPGQGKHFKANQRKKTKRNEKLNAQFDFNAWIDAEFDRKYGLTTEMLRKLGKLPEQAVVEPQFVVNISKDININTIYTLIDEATTSLIRTLAIEEEVHLKQSKLRQFNPYRTQRKQDHTLKMKPVTAGIGDLAALLFRYAPTFSRRYQGNTIHTYYRYLLFCFMTDRKHTSYTNRLYAYRRIPGLLRLLFNSIQSEPVCIVSGYSGLKEDYGGMLPQFLTYSDLPNYCLLLSTSTTDIAWRKYCIKNNTIPGARFANHLLINRDEVSPHLNSYEFQNYDLNLVVDERIPQCLATNLQFAEQCEIIISEWSRSHLTVFVFHPSEITLSEVRLFALLKLRLREVSNNTMRYLVGHYHHTSMKVALSWFDPSLILPADED